MTITGSSYENDLMKFYRLQFHRHLLAKIISTHKFAYVRKKLVEEAK